MKNTGRLAVMGDFSMKEGSVTIHPNDGFDLGLMTTDYPVYLFTNTSVEDFKAGNGNKISGSISLRNECKVGTVEMNLKVWEGMGKPKHVVLCYEDAKLLIAAPSKQ